MSFQEYAKTKHTFPYILDITAGKAHLVYFGIRHTRDPKDKQLKQIRAIWQKLKPDEVFNEDITPQPRATLEDSVKFDGERGALAYWAHQNHVQIKTIDRTWREQVQRLPLSIRGSSIKMFFLIRGLEQDLKKPNAGTPEQTAQRELDFLNSQNISWPPNKVSEIDSFWKMLDMGGDWRKPKIAWIDPSGNGPLNNIGKALSKIRDEQMVETLEQELKKGKRILGVVGGSHVIMQEPALTGRKGRL